MLLELCPRFESLMPDLFPSRLQANTGIWLSQFNRCQFQPRARMSKYLQVFCWKAFQSGLERVFRAPLQVRASQERETCRLRNVSMQ